MESKIYNTTITIEGVEMKNNKLTLLAHDRKRYGFWMTKKDGSDSAPYLQFKSMNLKQGDNVYIGYVLEPYTDARGVNREALKIINFRETNERPTQTASQPESIRIGQNNASGEVREDTFWDKKAYKQRLWNYFLHNRLLTLSQGHMDTVWEAFKQIEKDCENRFNPSPLR